MKFYQNTLATPFGKLAFVYSNDYLCSIEFMSKDFEVHKNEDSFSLLVKNEITSYLNNPKHVFNIPYKAHGTPFQLKVWDALQRISSGECQTYGSLARKLHTSPRALGQACRTNHLPLIIPCHRVVGQKDIGGFVGERTGLFIDVKNWLLKHEGYGLMSS